MFMGGIMVPDAGLHSL